MKGNYARKGITLVLATMMAMAVMTGCGNKNSELVTISESETPKTDSVDAGYIEALKSDIQEDILYTHENGWSVRYNPSCITVNGGGPITTFVYTADCPGTCMITVTYDVNKNGKEAADELAKRWGDEAVVSECIFPATEDVNGFYVDAHPGQIGPGFYESAYVRDYLDGYLMFEFTDHVSGDDAIDIPVSDTLSAIIDSLQFN